MSLPPGCGRLRRLLRAACSAAAQARSVVGLIDELAIEGVVIAGYDIGSRIAQTVARAVPRRVRSLVLAPPLPGAGERVLTPDAQLEFWYQPFHRREPRRAGGAPTERIEQPTWVLWPEHDPLEAPQAFAAAIREADAGVSR